MNRDELISFVQSEKGIAATERALALFALRKMSSKNIERVSELVEKGIPMLRAGDSEGVIALLSENGLPASYLPQARRILDASRRYHNASQQ